MHDPSEDSGVYYAINDRWHEGGHNMRAQRTMGWATRVPGTRHRVLQDLDSKHGSSADQEAEV